MIISKDSNLVGLKTNEKNISNLIPNNSLRKFTKRILEILNDSKAEEIIFIDAKDKLFFTDYLIICQGRSQPHCRSIAQNLEYILKQEGQKSLGLEGEREGNWVLLDYGEIILHVFHPEIRKYYNLEDLYKNHLKIVF